MPRYLHLAVSFMCFAAVRNNALNLAVNKPVFESSATDGIMNVLNSDITDGNVGTTGKWLMIDLLQEYYITRVNIVKSKHSLQRRVVIETFLSNPSMFGGAHSSVCGIGITSANVTCPDTLSGRFVRIRELNSSDLLLYEVSVMGTDTSTHKARSLRTERVYSKLRGQHLTAKVSTTYEKVSKLRCAVKCRSDGHCQAFQFRDVTSTCNIIKNTWMADVFTKDVSWNLYYV